MSSGGSLYTNRRFLPLLKLLLLLLAVFFMLTLLLLLLLLVLVVAGLVVTAPANCDGDEDATVVPALVVVASAGVSRGPDAIMVAFRSPLGVERAPVPTGDEDAVEAAAAAEGEEEFEGEREEGPGAPGSRGAAAASPMASLRSSAYTMRRIGNCSIGSPSSAVTFFARTWKRTE